jgi:hypothetical protein
MDTLLGNFSVKSWDDNIKIDLKGIGFDVVDWIHLAQDGI